MAPPRVRSSFPYRYCSASGAAGLRCTRIRGERRPTLAATRLETPQYGQQQDGDRDAPDRDPPEHEEEVGVAGERLCGISDAGRNAREVRHEAAEVLRETRREQPRAHHESPSLRSDVSRDHGERESRYEQLCDRQEQITANHPPR